MSQADLIASTEQLEDLSQDVAAVARLETVRTILEVCLQVTGMGYAVVARVTDDRWLACAVLDTIEFGLEVGGELPIDTTICHEVRGRREPIAFDEASADPVWRKHNTPKLYGLESYIAVPIVLRDDEFFGTLCAIDPRPAPASRPTTVRMFEMFAQLIADHLSNERELAASRAAESDARASAELREQLMAVLGHDLRNPLAAIEAGVRVLERRSADPALTPILTEMKRTTGRMARLISDVLDFARGRLGGGLTAVKRPSDLAEALRGVVGEFRGSHPKREIETRIALKDEVLCDPDRIAQLVSNLLANAIAHGDAGEPVRLFASVDAGVLVLSVQNAGGLAPAAAAQLFEPFNRGQAGHAREGLGLGLYISRQIAEAHGGTLKARTTPTSVEFLLRVPVV